MMNAVTPSIASETTWKVTSSRLWRFTMRAGSGDRAPPSRRRTARGRSARRAGGWRPRRTRRSIASRDAVGERLGRRLVDEDAGLAGDDGFERAAAAERDDRPSARLRFERHDAEVLFARQQRHRRAAVQLANLVVGAAAEKLHVGAGRRARGARAPVRRRRSSAARRPGGSRRSRDRCACRAPAPTRRARIAREPDVVGMKELGVDGRIHHGRLAIIVSADPARNIMRDSDIAVRAARRVAVPARQPRHHRPHHARCRAARPARGPK